MASSAASKRLKKLADEIPSDSAIRLVLQHLEPDHIDFSDHAIAMIGASVVDKALEVSILTRMRPMDEEERKRLFRYDHNGPIADFSARIKVAHALNIFGSKTRTDLNLIREIRNAFSHAVKFIRFDNPEVAEMCMALHIPETTTIAGGAGVDKRKPRGRYIEATVTIAERLKSALSAPPVGGGDLLHALYRRSFLP